MEPEAAKVGDSQGPAARDGHEQWDMVDADSARDERLRGVRRSRPTEAVYVWDFGRTSFAVIVIRTSPLSLVMTTASQGLQLADLTLSAISSRADASAAA